LQFFFGGRLDGGVVGLVELDHVPDNPGQFMGHGGDGFGCSQPRFPAPEAVADWARWKGRWNHYGHPARDIG
ncbi:MAG: hypothetical protein ABIP76_00310, partial [Verrucomicrobiota bacterium]